MLTRIYNYIFLEYIYFLCYELSHGTTMKTLSRNRKMKVKQKMST